jgi:hypothetical protein
MLYAFGGLIAALLISIGYGGCQYKEVQRLETEIEANKVEAERLLNEAKKEGELNAKNAQKDYDEALVAIRKRASTYTGKLRDPSGKGCPAASPASPGFPQNTATGSELSDEAGNFLRNEADRADEAAIYALKCQQFATKPSILQSVEALKGK